MHISIHSGLTKIEPSKIFDTEKLLILWIDDKSPTTDDNDIVKSKQCESVEEFIKEYTDYMLKHVAYALRNSSEIFVQRVYEKQSVFTLGKTKESDQC